MKRMVVSQTTKADAKTAHEAASRGRIGKYRVIRVLGEPKPVYARWQFDIEVEG